MLGLVVLAFLGWSGWWWLASGAAMRGAEAMVTTLQARGWQADHDGLAVAGYPNRIDLTATAPRLATPGGNWGWSAPFAQVFALSYKPWHLIAAVAPDQRLRTPSGDWTLQADHMQASLVLVPGADLTLDRFQLSTGALALEGAVRTGAESLSLASRPTAGQALAHDIGLDIRAIAADPRLLALLPAGLLPDHATVLRLDAVAAFAAPLDRHAATALPPLTGLTLRELRGEWGPIRAHVSGHLAPDARGLAQGQLDLRLEGAAAALELAIALGMVAPEARATWAGMVAALAPGGAALTLPLRLAGGRITLGPLPLGPAPRLVW